MRKNLSIALSTLLVSSFALAEDAPKQLQLYNDMQSIVFETKDGPVEITRFKTEAALIGGVLQPIVPVEGVHPIGEVELLSMVESGEATLVDMRYLENYLDGTIPGAMNIPYTDIALHLDKLGCEGSDGNWTCTNAVKVIGFCNGPACPQSPMAMKVMAREGYPMDRVYYYRGGMQDWKVLGLTTVEGEL